MSVTIESLDIQIKSSAGSAATNIEQLADSLGKLREKSKLTTVTNNLSKLATALDKLESSSMGVSKIRALAGALKSLTQIGKMSGVTSALNALSKIPDVVKKLDGATLTVFAAKMREVADALAPLAARLDTVSRSFSKLPSRISQIVTGTNKMAKASRDAADAHEDQGTALNAFQINLAATLTNIQGFIHGLQAVKEKMAAVLNEAISWDGIQFRFGQAFAEDAEDVYDWVLKINEALGISVQEFMQYSGIYASLLKGFGVEQSKLTEISVGLTELTYDIWAFSNDRYKNLEDAAEAVRSAITGEIEPIRNAGIALTEASMQEYLDSIGQASVSIEKLTEAQKAEVRYAVMVQSAMQQGIVGTYAREMDTAEGAVRRLSQQMKTLAQKFGSLFIPLLQIAIPWITAFVDIVTDAVEWLGALFGVKIGKIDWSKTTTGVDGLADGAKDANEALGSASDAAKKLKSYTMGFDELNVINPGSDSAGTGGAGGAEGNGFQGLDLKSIWDDALLESASKKVDEIKAKILEWKVPILTVLGLLGAAGMIGLLATIISKIVNATNLARAFAGAVTGNSAAMSALTFLSEKWANVATVITSITAKIGGLAGGFQSAMSVAGSFISGLTAGPILLIAGIIAAIVAVVVFLKRNWEEVTAAVKGFLNVNIAPKLEVIKEKWEEMKKALSGLLPDKVPKWFKDLGDVFEVVGGIIFGVVSTVIAGAFSSFVQMIAGLVTAFTGIVQVVSGVFKLVVGIFTGDGDKIREAASQIIQGVANVFGGLWNAVVGGVTEFFRGVIQWFTKLWDELVGHSIVPDTINAIVEWFLSLPGKVWGKLKEFCDGVKQRFMDLWDGIKAWYANSVAPKLTLSFWLEKFSNLKEGFTKTIKNAVNAGIDMMNRFISWINSHLSFSWDAITIAGKEIVPAGSIQLFNIPRIPYLADGGFVGAGQMFIAREAGPELVGNINGRTAVANNDQIVAAVSRGVYEAVAAAMGANRGAEGQSINVYLDGRQITAAVEKRQGERGVSLMGNQLGYAY